MLYNILNNNTERISENKYTNYEIETAFSQKKLNDVDHTVLLDVEEFEFIGYEYAEGFALDNGIDYSDIVRVEGKFYLKAE